MRRIVTEIAAGRSRVLIDEAVAADAPLAMLWDASAAQPIGYPPEQAPNAKPAIRPGQTSWRVVMVPPDAVMRDYLAGRPEGFDERGFHTTETVDYVVILDGPVTLALDDEEIDLEPGDLVVQRATRHAWFNRGDRPIRLLVLLAGIDPVAAGLAG